MFASRDLPHKVLTVSRTDDFDVNGRGDAPAWEKARWEPLQLRSAGSHPYQTRVKMLYSATGLYVLMDATDRVITATMKEDFLDLWNEDVFEFFLWPDERHPVYFEYEISPLGFELPILIPNLEGKFLGWRPWHYDGPRKTRKATMVAGGPKQAGAEVDRLESRGLRALRIAQAPGKRSSQARNSVASQFLSCRLRRRTDRQLGLGTGRPQLSRVPQVRHARFRMKCPRSPPGSPGWFNGFCTTLQMRTRTLAGAKRETDQTG